MAREEHDREELLAEATALVERAEIVDRASGRHVVFGFRRNGALSIYFESDPVFHFNSRNELRRAYINARLVKAEKGRLVALERGRTATEVQFVRHPLSDEATTCAMADLAAKLEALRLVLAARDYDQLGQAPAECEVIGRMSTWIAALEQPIVIADRPHVA